VVSGLVAVLAGVRGGELEVRLGAEAEGRVVRFPGVWLRDNCLCGECADPVAGQKLHGVTDIPLDASVVEAEMVEAEAGGDGVAVTFGPDGHRGLFELGWLARHALDGYEDELDGYGDELNGKELWGASADIGAVPEARWPCYVADPAARIGALRAVLRWGFVVLREVPAVPGRVLEVAESFGFVRETNYGRLFDVRIEPAPGNLAFTSREILPHTDNPYRDPVPTIQLLHCLRVADEGGDTGLVDGFAAAAELQATDPEAFEVLTGTTVRFEYRDKAAVLSASQPLIQLSPRGTVRGIRFNNRSVQPIRLPYERVREFYAAYRTWAELLARPERRLVMRLAPGDCLIFDNTRILHARTAFSVTGSRHLQGCYADLDGLASTLAVLERETR
jgi:gamma-butyrobetaine dioxygenase